MIRTNTAVLPCSARSNNTFAARGALMNVAVPALGALRRASSLLQAVIVDLTSAPRCRAAIARNGLG
jgi:hypothetical protein